MKFNAVFAISLAICLPIGAWGVLQPSAMTDAAMGFTTYVMTGASWFWLLLCTGLVLLSAGLAFGPYGSVRLGRDHERPEFSTGSWLAMLFAGGMGAGLLFWGVAEPVLHFDAPPGMVGGTPEAAREAMVITNLHWGLHAWSIYGVCALVIGYFSFRRGQPSLISTPIRTLFRGQTAARASAAADVLGVVAVVFGLAGSLAMGVLQVRSGLREVFDVPATSMTAIGVLAVLFVFYMLSASTGVDKGIKILSNINVLLALFILLFVISFGPTDFILETFVDTIGGYASRLPEMAFRLFPYEGMSGWSVSWTLTYLIWWLAWGPFVGIFIARISRGRTIREFCIGVILVPTLFSILWFAALGGSAFYIELFGPGGLSELVAADVSDALFAFFRYFPFSEFLSVIAVLLVFIFLVTSADSGTFVLSMMTTNGNLNPPIGHKFVWGILIAAITGATLFSGSVDVARAMAATGAIPFSAILMLQVIGFLRALREERRGAMRLSAEAVPADEPVRSQRRTAR
ncbi:MAG TPA: BCCT family transporter [Alphaproteobacteria bacterium]|nr:BCCT family transporter [Alphaproteobacteria bacterium]